MNNYLLKGDLHKEGLFPDERTVQFADAQGKAISVTVSGRKIVIRGGIPYLIVRVLRQEQGAALVLLPGEVYGAGQMVAVTSNQLEPVAG
jgi:hypothetical protein